LHEDGCQGDTHPSGGNGYAYSHDFHQFNLYAVQAGHEKRPADGASVDKIIGEYQGREDELLEQLEEIVESRPFDKPIKEVEDTPDDEIEEGPTGFMHQKDEFGPRKADRMSLKPLSGAPWMRQSGIRIGSLRLP
jgi:hypothetical protein